MQPVVPLFRSRRRKRTYPRRAYSFQFDPKQQYVRSPPARKGPTRRHAVRAERAPNPRDRSAAVPRAAGFCASIDRRFTRLTNGFSKKLDNHIAAVALYVGHYNLCRVHETLRTTPAAALGITDHVWTIGELLDAALATQPEAPEKTAPDRRRRFRVIKGGLSG